MSALHWFPFYWEDYSTKTMHLTQAQHGAYMLLLRWVYTTGKPVPDKQKYSIAQARLKPELDATDAVLAEFFEENGGFWVNIRACEVMEAAADKHRTNSEKGRAGGRKRASNAQARLNHSSSNYNYTQNNKEEVKKEKATPTAQPFVPPDFIPNLAWEDFLEMRKKQRRPATEKAKALLARSLEKLMIQGHDPGTVLEQSTMNGWTDVYPIKEKGNGNGRLSRKSNHETFYDAASAVAARIASRGNGEAGSPEQATILLLPARPDKTPD